MQKEVFAFIVKKAVSSSPATRFLKEAMDVTTFLEPIEKI